MARHGPVYNETTDLYLQLLSAARELEDQRLAKMILQRVMALHRESGAPFGNIIPFPMPLTPCVPDEPERPFWTQGQFWQDMVPFVSVLSLFMSCFVYFVYLFGVTRSL